MEILPPSCLWAPLQDWFPTPNSQFFISFPYFFGEIVRHKSFYSFYPSYMCQALKRRDNSRPLISPYQFVGPVTQLLWMPITQGVKVSTDHCIFICQFEEGHISCQHALLGLMGQFCRGNSFAGSRPWESCSLNTVVQVMGRDSRLLVGSTQQALYSASR